MARTIGTDFSTQLASTAVNPFFAVEFLYPQPLRVWTGTTAFIIDGQTYLGLGNLISIDQVGETAETKANGMKVTCGGLDTNVLANSLNDTQQGILVNIKFGVLTTTDNALTVVDTSYTLFSGYVDTVAIDEQGDSSTIQFSIESKLIALETPLDFRYTDQDQKFFFPNDRGLEFVDDLQDKNVVWGGNGS